jgi:hypothetical protein
MIVFSKSQNFESIFLLLSESLAGESKGFARFRGGWPANCVTRSCLRIAFNNMNKNRVSSAKTAVMTVGQGFWRTSGALRRIRGRKR